MSTGATLRRWRRSLARRIDPSATTRPRPAAEPAAQRRIREKHARLEPAPSMTRHDLLERLHATFAPRTYLEIGVRQGWSLTLSRARTIAVDPVLQISSEICCDLQLVQSTSDEFFARDDPTAHLGGPIDLAFVDGMHLAEYAYRDIANVARHLSPTGVVVVDDVFPRSVSEAARERSTVGWAGDVYKVVPAIREAAPGALVLPLNTAPTGTAVIVGLDPASTVLQDAYESLRPRLTSPDPQDLPPEILTRTRARDPRELLDSGLWERLRELRDAGAGPTEVATALEPWR